MCQLWRQSGRRPAVGRTGVPGIGEKTFIKSCDVIVCAEVNCSGTVVWLGTGPSFSSPLRLGWIRLLAFEVPAAVFCRGALLQKMPEVPWVLILLAFLGGTFPAPATFARAFCSSILFVALSKKPPLNRVVSFTFSWSSSLSSGKEPKLGLTRDQATRLLS